MKYFKLLGIFILLFTLSFGIYIECPTKVAENAVLYFSINFEDEQFDEVKVLVDGVEILRAFSNMQIVVFKKNVISAFFIDESPQTNEGLILYVAYIGLKENMHTIKAITYLNSAEENQTSVNISVYKPVESSELNTLSSDLSILQNDVEGIKNNISTLNETSDTLSQNINNLEQKQQELEKENSEFKSSINNIFEKFEDYDKRIENLKNKNSELAQELEKLKEENLVLKGKIQLLEENLSEKEKGITSFITANSSIIIGIIILLILIILVYLKREKLKEMFSKKEEIDIFPEEESEEKTRKWQYEDFEKKSDEVQKFSLGDLIKKD